MSDTQNDQSGVGTNSAELAEMLDAVSADLFPGSEEGTGEEVTEGKVVEGAVTPPPATPVDNPPPAEEGSTSTPPPPADSVLPPPKTWRPEATADWAKTPVSIQREIAKREEDMFRGIETYKFDAGIGKRLQKIVEPYAEMFLEAKIDPLQQVGELMRAHVELSTAPAEKRLGYFKALAAEYGINIGAEELAYNQETEHLRGELKALKSRIELQEGSQVEVVKAKLSSEISAFASDPKNQYFEEVAGEIAALIRTGQAKTLPEAYEAAVMLNPVTRAKELDRLTTEKLTKAQAAEAERASKAKAAAAINVRSRPKAASGTAPLGTMDETLEATLAEINARSK